MKRQTSTPLSTIIGNAFIICLTILTGTIFAQNSKPAGQPKQTPPAQTPQNQAPSGQEKPVTDEKSLQESSRRVELNMLGKTDTSSGESRRNENVQFNLVDNNALKELSIRLGTTATLVREFSPASNYFAAEFGNAPRNSITVPGPLRNDFHGQLSETHQNSVFSARSFFQVGEVQPARENDYGLNVGFRLGKRTGFYLEGSQQKLRGIVNGNVLVPRPDERTPLTNDPAIAAVVNRFLAAYPKQLPNRTDINARALNTNAPQRIDNNQGGMRLDHTFNKSDRLGLQYQYTAQSVDAFQLVAGQNPDTNTKSHLARMVWTPPLSAKILSNFSVSYDRLTSLLRPEENAVGPFLTIAGLTSLGPDGAIPIDRAQNTIRTAAQFIGATGKHNWSAGATIIRRQVNGTETDVHRGFFSFSNDFGTDAMTNLRLGRPSQAIVSVGNIHRGFRLWELNLYAGDKLQLNRALTIQYGLRWQPSTRPTEVNNLNRFNFDSDWNNLAPTVGFAWRMPRKLGVWRGAYGTHFGEIFYVTYQQIRFSPPLNNKIIVLAPNLLDPLNTPFPDGSKPKPLPTIYDLDRELATPYSHQYNLSWEPEWNLPVRLQFGYAGSRSHKLFSMWYLNRAEPVAGIPQITATVNQRRPDKTVADYRLVLNGSRGFYDAARVSVILPPWRGLTIDASYWFSKAIDLGSAYTNTANELDARLSRSQSAFNVQKEQRGLSFFDQKHAFLLRTSYRFGAPSFLRNRVNVAARAVETAIDGWTLSGIVLLKSGTPFNIQAGSDGPGYGNVDGNGGDRPNIIDPSILGRTIGDPDTSKQLLPRSAFSFINPTELAGSLGRNVFRKGAIRNVNAALARNWTIFSEMRLTFRAESINFFNTPQFAEPGAELANPNFGAITNTLNDGRTFKFTLQLGW